MICEKCLKEKPDNEVKRRTFFPTRKDGIGKLPKWIKTQQELCEDCYKELDKVLENVIK